MPTNKKKKDKNKKKENQTKKQQIPGSESSTSCARCSRWIGKRSDAVVCVCTRVLFCSDVCKTVSIKCRQHVCPGPPERVINVSQRMEQSGESVPDVDEFGSWADEMKKTIHDPLSALIFRKRRGGPGLLQSDIKAETYAKWADEGHACCAYLAGSMYKNGLSGKMSMVNGTLISDSTGGEDEMNLLSMDQLAFKYMLQAAEAGIGLGMQSVAECYQQGQGVRKSMLHCRDWLWRAALQRSCGALALLDERITIPYEIHGIMSVIQQFPTVCPGQSIDSCGPNITSLLVTCLKNLSRSNYQLPPFSGTVPTLTVGRKAAKVDSPPVKIVSSGLLQELVKIIRFSESQGYEVKFTYGRRGTGKEATVQTYGSASRSIDCDLFIIPPEPACDERVDDCNEVGRLASTFARALPRGVYCVHGELHQKRQAISTCWDCLKLAQERMTAVSLGCVVLSIDEHLESRGRTAIYKTTFTGDGDDGLDTTQKCKSETFKHYCRGEVETVLAALVAHNPDLAHPLFIAQDPNLYWPIIQSHGCIRSALEYVSPHVDWNRKLGSVIDPPLSVPILTDAESNSPLKAGTILVKCGNDLCLNLEEHYASSQNSFQFCSGCERRSYCSANCFAIDWINHKRECSANTSSSTTNNPPGQVSKSRSKRNILPPPPATGEDVIVHGLEAKPHYNGLVGVVSGNLSNGRYPVKVHCGGVKATKIAVKPDNLHTLNIRHRDRQEKKASTFECLLHREETCEDCSYDFSVVNYLSKLQFRTGSKLSTEAIAEAAESQFASMPDTRDFEIRNVGREYPHECQGLNDIEKRFILKALLEDKRDSKSTVASAALVGLACYSARCECSSRPSVIPHLVQFMEKI